jgi:hypothetical protein
MTVPIVPFSARRATPPELLTVLIAYLQLLNATYEATEQGLPATENPVPLKELSSAGVGSDFLLWLLFQGQVIQLGQPGAVGDEAGFQPMQSARIGERSSFVLTEFGVACAELFVGWALVPENEGEFDAAWDLLPMGWLTPRYDAERRRFTWGHHVLKQFMQPSDNQAMVLSAAEEQEWPIWFDDPLPRVCGIGPKVRLHDAIKRLNRHQKPYLVRFKGDGTGTQVGWELR